MSVYAMAAVWKQSRLKGPARLVLLAVADCCNDEGEAWPSIKTIAEKCLISERQVQSMLRRAAELGEIEIDEKGGKKTATGATNRYRLLLSIGVKDSTPLGGRGEENRTPGVKDCVNQGTKGVKDSTPNPTYDPSIDPSLFREGDLVLVRPPDDVWSEFRKIYPSRDGGLNAAEGKRKFDVLVRKGEDPEAILAGARLYRKWADARQKTGTQYIAQIPTWLNQQRWKESFGASAGEIEADRRHPVRGTDYVLQMIDGFAVLCIPDTSPPVPFDRAKWYSDRGLIDPEAA
jgi:hypothetical protein